MGLKKSKWTKRDGFFYSKRKNAMGLHLVAFVDQYGGYAIVGAVARIPTHREVRGK